MFIWRKSGMSSADPRGCTELELASIPILMIKAEKTWDVTART